MPDAGRGLLEPPLQLNGIPPETMPRTSIASPWAVSSHQSVSGKGTSFAGRGSLRSQQPVLHRENRL